MKSILRSLALAVGILAAGPSLAADYPTQPVTLIIPYTPGASNDVFGRFVADGLSKLWRQPVVVENMPGAGGSIGMAKVVNAPADGYTLLWASSTFSTNAAAQTNLPFDFAEDLQPIGKIGDGQLILVTGSRVPMKTLDDLVREAKAQTIFYGATGPASTPTFMAKLLSDELGIEMEGANYTGGAEAMVDLIGGRIDVYIGTVTTILPAIQNGTATPIAVFGETRSPVLPDVPTIGELGYPAAQAGIWWGLFGPAGLPADIVEKINADIATVVTTPEAAEMFNAQGGAPRPLPVADFSKLVRDELAKWEALAAKHQIVAN
jgi:tripartite-type tricarboxylate transporter receptor subunit TctC